MEDPSDLTTKRKQLTQSIRRKEVSDYMQKRRYSLLTSDLLSNSNQVSDKDKTLFLHKLLQQFPIKTPINFFHQTMQLDKTLSLFYNVTGFNPNSPPNFVCTLFLENPCLRTHYDRLSVGQWQNRQWRQQQLEGLRALHRQMKEWWRKQNQTVKDILYLMNRIDNINLLIQQEILSFITIVTNTMLLFEIITKVTGENIRVAMLVGQDVPLMEKERDLFLRLLYNILAAEDDVLRPQLDGLLDALLNPHLLDLYYNVFLVQGVDQRLRVKMMKYFVTLLSSDPQQLLQNHKQIIFTLYVCMKNNPVFEGPERKDYLEVGQTLVTLLNNLLKVLNFRYENCGLYLISQLSNHSDEDSQFVKHIARILYELTAQIQTLRLLMQKPDIATFIANHIQIESGRDRSQTVLYLLHILDKSSKDHCSQHYFLNKHIRTQHRLVAIVTSLSQKLYQIDAQTQIDIIQQFLVICANFCEVPKLGGLFLTSNLHHVAAKLYFCYQQTTFRRIRIECQSLFVNLLHHLMTLYAQNQYDNNAHLFSLFFSTEEIFEMFLDLFKYAPHRSEIARRALNFLAFIYKIDVQDDKFTQWLHQIKHNSTLQARLYELGDCGDEQIEQKIYVIDAIKKEMELVEEQDVIL